VSAVFRSLNWIMCALFLLSAWLQWNDPDPLRWVAIYGAAFAASLVVGLRRRVHPAAPLLVSAIAIVWSLGTMRTGPSADSYGHMFDAWQMKSSTVEEAREATGLLIVAAWMLVVVVAQGRVPGGKR
jgi:hypothetical protein